MNKIHRDDTEPQCFQGNIPQDLQEELDLIYTANDGREQELKMTLQDGNTVKAGDYWILNNNNISERTLISVDYNGHFRNIPSSAMLNAIEMKLDIFGWTGPVTVLPEPAHKYHNRVNLSKYGHANSTMLEWIYHTTEGLHGTVRKIRVYIANDNGFDIGLNFKTENELRSIIQPMDNTKHITYWIFFYTQGQAYPNMLSAEITPNILTHGSTNGN